MMPPSKKFPENFDIWLFSTSLSDVPFSSEEWSCFIPKNSLWFSWISVCVSRFRETERLRYLKHRMFSPSISSNRESFKLFPHFFGLDVLFQGYAAYNCIDWHWKCNAFIIFDNSLFVGVVQWWQIVNSFQFLKSQTTQKMCISTIEVWTYVSPC